MGRILLAGLLAAFVVFCWGAVAHMGLRLGKTEIAPDAAQQVALAALAGSLEREGAFVMPMPQESIWDDEAAMQRFGADAASRPYAFVVFQPQGTDFNAAFGGLLGRQFAICVLAGVLAAWLAAGWSTRARRVLGVTALGLFAWLAVSAPQWNWYRFPLDYVLGTLVEHVVGWLLAGLAIAWLLPRPDAAR